MGNAPKGNASAEVAWAQQDSLPARGKKGQGEQEEWPVLADLAVEGLTKDTGMAVYVTQNPVSNIVSIAVGKYNLESGRKLATRNYAPIVPTMVCFGNAIGEYLETHRGVAGAKGVIEGLFAKALAQGKRK